MDFKEIIFTVIAVLGAIINFTSRFISEKTMFSELKIKVFALIVVILSISLLFITA